MTKIGVDKVTAKTKLAPFLARIVCTVVGLRIVVVSGVVQRFKSFHSLPRDAIFVSPSFSLHIPVTETQRGLSLQLRRCDGSVAKNELNAFKSRYG